MEYNEIIIPINKISLGDIQYINGKYVITAYGVKEYVGDAYYFDGNYHLIITDDLINFDDKIITQNKDQYDLNAHPMNLLYGNGLYVINIENRLLISKDLVSFSEKDISFISDNFADLYFVNGQFLAITQEYEYNNQGSLIKTQSQIWTSTNCENWNNIYTLSGSTIWDITFKNNTYYICGTNGMIKKSTNLVNWIDCTSELNGIITNIESGTNLLIASGYKIENNKQIPYIVTSNDGNNFEVTYKCKEESGTPSINYGNGIYMLMANDYLAYSKDGKNFQILLENDMYYFSSMIFSADRLQFAIISNNSSKHSLLLVNVTRDIATKIDADEELIYIYDLNFNFIGTIDSFKSLIWTRKYFEAGQFQLTVPANENNIDMLKLNYIVVRNNYTEAAIIETIEFSDDGSDEDLTISGNFLSIILNRRIVKTITNFTGSVIDGMKKLINEMTPFPKLTVEPNSLSSPNIQFQCSYKNVYDYIVKLAKYSGIGFRIVANVENKVFIFENFKGKDRTNSQSENERYSFSDEEFNLTNPSLTISTVNKINYCLVGGQGEGTERVIVEVKDGTATGFDLYESFVDAKSSSDDNLSETDYKNALIQEGENSLQDNISEFKFDVEAVDYKDKYDLGDIVDCACVKCGYYASLRITEIEEVIEDGKRSISITLGTTIPEIWED